MLHAHLFTEKVAVMNEQNSNSKAYNPCDHLVAVKTASGSKEHYPFNWRLHEFRLRYPNGVLTAEILHLDVERDLVIVKATALESDLGNGKGAGLQVGSLALLDKVTERAKAQALADMGIGCAWPVIFDGDLDSIEVVHPDEQVNSQADERQVQSNGHKPARTAATIQAFFAKQYQVKPVDLDTRWEAFKKHVLNEVVADDALIEEQLNRLNSYISQQYQKQQSQRLAQKVS
jgi:hypothetical protein